MKIEQIKIEEIKENELNPKQLLPNEESDLIESITRFGIVDPLILNSAPKRKNFLIGGHQRLSVLKKMGYTEVPCIFVDIPDLEKEMELVVRLSKNTGSWDKEKLKELNVDMLLEVGFDNDELSDMWDEIGTTEDNHKAEKAISEAKKTLIRNGDIFQLGAHRLMCGDSTNLTDVNKLMNGEKALMIYCDPPYNIGLNYGGGIGTANKYQGTYKDSKEDSDYAEFLRLTIFNALENALENAHIFYWCDEKYIGMVQELYRILGLENRRVCMWIKNNQNPTPQVAFNKVYEPCVYGTRGKPFLNNNYRAFNEVLNKEVDSGNKLQEDIKDLFNIWLEDRDPAKDYDHPTQKPITLHEKALKRCSQPGSIVVDLFGGSGSTLMACEQMKRKCYTLEMSPIFCQVIINRWQEYTGEKAIKIN